MGKGDVGINPDLAAHLPPAPAERHILAAPLAVVGVDAGGEKLDVFLFAGGHLSAIPWRHRRQLLHDVSADTQEPSGHHLGAQQRPLPDKPTVLNVEFAGERDGFLLLRVDARNHVGIRLQHPLHGFGLPTNVIVNPEQVGRFGMIPQELRRKLVAHFRQVWVAADEMRHVGDAGTAQKFAGLRHGGNVFGAQAVRQGGRRKHNEIRGADR